jgi:hypothetical protein
MQSPKKPKTLAEIDKHFRLSCPPQRKVKIDLKTKGIRPLEANLLYAKQFQQKLRDLGKLMVCRLPRKGSAHQSK